MGSSYRGRTRSYTPPPPRRRQDDHPSREHRYPDRRSQRSPGPSGLLVRNISLTARPEDLRARFESFGPVKDVYLPKNYYTGEQRGFGFVKFRNAEDAAEAKHHLDQTVIGGREIAIVFAAEKRKTPHEMRRTGRMMSSHHGNSNRRRSPSRSPRRSKYLSYSRSPSPARHETRIQFCRGRGGEVRDYYTASHSRSLSPRQGGAHGSIRNSAASPKRKQRRQSPFDKMDQPGSASPQGERRRADQRSPRPTKDDEPGSPSPQVERRRADRRSPRPTKDDEPGSPSPQGERRRADRRSPRPTTDDHTLPSPR